MIAQVTPSLSEDVVLMGIPSLSLGDVKYFGQVDTYLTVILA